MHEAVEDGIGECRVSDDVVPLLDRELPGDDGRADAVPVLEDFEQVVPVLGVERGRPADEDVEVLGDPAPVGEREEERLVEAAQCRKSTSSGQASCLRQARRNRFVSCRECRSVISRSTSSPRRSSNDRATTSDESSCSARAWAIPAHRSCWSLSTVG